MGFWSFLRDFLTLSNAPNALIWVLILIVLVYGLGKAYTLIADGNFERRVLRPDTHGRYPVLLVKNNPEKIIFFDKDLGWRTLEIGEANEHLKEDIWVSRDEDT